MHRANLSLNTLYQQRPNLNEAEWAELYGLIKRILEVSSRWNFATPEDKEDAINSFFIEKIFSPASGRYHDNDCKPGLILEQFKNFMIDQTKKPANKLSTVSLDAADEDDDASASEKWLEDGKSFEFSPDQLEETLSQYNLSRARISDSAITFFEGLEDYARQALSCHLCADADHAVPLSSIQQRYPQTATYYKIKKLGILHKKNSMPAQYDQTVIGQWLKQTLDIEIEARHMEIIAIALQILCVVALQALDV